MRGGGRYSPAKLVAGMAAAAALLFYALCNWDHGRGWPPLFLAVVLMIALVLRRFFFPG